MFFNAGKKRKLDTFKGRKKGWKSPTISLKFWLKSHANTSQECALQITLTLFFSLLSAIKTLLIDFQSTRDQNFCVFSFYVCCILVALIYRLRSPSCLCHIYAKQKYGLHQLLYTSFTWSSGRFCIRSAY